MAEIFSIVSGKGGIGKTALAAEIAAELSLLGGKVLLLDLNVGSGEAELLFSAKERAVYHLPDVLEGNCKIIQALLQFPEYPGLYLLPASRNRDMQSVNPAKFAKLMEMFNEQFDFVVIDVPTGISEGFKMVAKMSTRLLLVASNDKLAFEASQTFAKKLPADIREKTALLMNRIRLNLVKAESVEVPETVIQALNLPLIGFVPEDENIYLLADKTRKITEIKTPAGREMERIAKRLMGEDIPFTLK